MRQDPGGLQRRTARPRSGELFQTGVPVTFRYMRNTAPSFYMGSRFGQDIEPAGTYMLLDDYELWKQPKEKQVSGWEFGTKHFFSPLVIAHASKGTAYGPFGWKRRLSEAYGGATGDTLSRMIRADGHDGIVTVGPVPNDVHEIVDLTRMPRAVAVRARKNPPQKEPCGECFRFANMYPAEHSRDMLENGVVVHGMLTNPDPGPGERERFEHAWIEYRGEVYDWQTIEFHHGPPLNLEAWYLYWKPTDMVRYTPLEAIGNMYKHKHHGPWHHGPWGSPPVYENPLIDELGPKNQFDVLAGKALQAGQSLGNFRLMTMAEKLSDMAHRIDYNSDQFFRVIALARDLEGAMTDAVTEANVRRTWFKFPRKGSGGDSFYLQIMWSSEFKGRAINFGITRVKDKSLVQYFHLALRTCIDVIGLIEDPSLDVTEYGTNEYTNLIDSEDVNERVIGWWCYHHHEDGGYGLEALILCDEDPFVKCCLSLRNELIDVLGLDWK